MTRKETIGLLAHVKRIYGKRFEIEEGAIDWWSDMLGDVSLEAAIAALRDHAAESPHQPTIADIRKRAMKPADDFDWDAAWAEITAAIRRVGSYGTPTWSTPALKDLVDGIGWRTICATEDDSVPTLRAQMRDMYALKAKRASYEANAGHLLKHHEQKNQIGETVAHAIGKVVHALAGRTE